MRLHQDPTSFQTILLTQSERTGIRADILEKDYYVTLMLEELSRKQLVIPAYFKGGTALYKALGSIRRFSEDIDLTVVLDVGMSNTQKKKRLEAASKGFQCLKRNREDGATIEYPGSITTTYDYHSIVSFDKDDTLQRFERIKIEATSFTVSEPHRPTTIEAILLSFATREERQVLASVFEVEPFSITTVTLERIFIDKVFAVEFYFSRGKFFDTAKHLYDLVVLLKDKRIQAVTTNHEELDTLISLKRKEEKARKDSDLSARKIGDFSYLYRLDADEIMQREFARMQKVYLFDNQYQLDVDDLLRGIQEIKRIFADW